MNKLHNEKWHKAMEERHKNAMSHGDLLKRQRLYAARWRQRKREQLKETEPDRYAYMMLRVQGSKECKELSEIERQQRRIAKKAAWYQANKEAIISKRKISPNRKRDREKCREYDRAYRLRKKAAKIAILDENS